MKTLELINKLKKDAVNNKMRFIKSPENKKLFRDIKKPGDFKDKTFLYIRATDTDTGNRPLPAGTRYWDSPDIELYDSNNNLIPTNKLNKNESYTINVLVHNDGDMTCNTCTVDLFICDPTIGFNRVNATQIGIQSIIVLGHNTEVASFNFIPTVENLGHQCLFSRAYSYVNGDLPDSGDIFSTSTDRHIGQQNLNVINQGTKFEFLLAPEFQKAKMRLKLTQNKKSTKELKIKTLKNLNISTKTIPVNKFVFFKNINPHIKELEKIPGTVNITPRNKEFLRTNKPGIKHSARNFPARILMPYIERLIPKKIDTKKFDLIKQVAENSWEYNYKGSIDKITLKIPYLFTKRNSAAIFDIEMINEETHKSIGGLTIIVKV